MADRAQDIKERLRQAGEHGAHANGSSAPERLPREVADDLHADERDPSRLAPSAEGIVTFAGLPEGVRGWLAAQLEELGGNGNGAGSRHELRNQRAD